MFTIHNPSTIGTPFVSCMMMKQMKFKTLALLLMALPFGLWGQSATISGEIEGNADAKLTWMDDALYLGAEPQSIEVKGGKFKFTLKADAPRMVPILYNGTSRLLFIEPGDELKLAISKDLNGFVGFAGKGSVANITLQELDQRFHNDFTDSLLRKEMLAKSVDIFEMQIFDKLQSHKDFIAKHPDKNNFTPAFQQYLDQHVRYNYLAALMAYPIENANASRTDRVVPLPQIMMDPITPERVQNPAALPDPKYRTFLKYFITYEGSRMHDFAKFTDQTQSLEHKYDAARQHLQGLPFDWYLAQHLLENADKCRPGAVRRIHRAIAEENGGAPFAAAVQAKWGDHMAGSDEAFTQTSGAGNPNAAPDDLWSLYDLDGNKVTLKDFKGKVVYIDFWASWCGPCRAQFPHAKALHERFSKKELKDLVFLYISLDKSEADWRKGLEQNQMEGFQTYSPANFNSEMANHFRINSIPRYMLVNKKGEVVDPNAKRPGMEGIYEDLIKLLSE